MIVCWPGEEEIEEECGLEMFSRLDEDGNRGAEISDPKRDEETQEVPVSSNCFVAFVGVKGSNEKYDLVGHEVGDDTRIEDEIIRVDISYPKVLNTLKRMLLNITLHVMNI